ncbi:MAG: polyhydroxyalkanoic acid system protein [Porticoccaceae bacterium]|nr:polyhydroxyalkanoic acid system protein [Porticoccaceae bacterium]
MALVQICRAHRLSGAELHDRVDALAGRLVARYGGDYRWQGDLVHYRRAGGVDAEIHCGAEQLRVEVSLGPLAGFLRGTIEREINAALDRHLGA